MWIFPDGAEGSGLEAEAESRSWSGARVWALSPPQECISFSGLLPAPVSITPLHSTSSQAASAPRAEPVGCTSSNHHNLLYALFFQHHFNKKKMDKIYLSIENN